ncbi:U-box domain-containing protein 4 [Phtheirospermum japonicum]|uniref:U-box domain-containing protein 4 n=1 Tax=Phtheirospermum japonicum TaxID=374723 RepID=A0A830CRT6_9LAMI|nr:U-box domain-containing protein 4 [Phtheirospermum japonicum]
MGDEDSSIYCHLTTTTLGADTAAPPTSTPSCSLTAVNSTLLFLQSNDLSLRIEAAKEIRRLTKTSQRYRRHFSAAVGPLVNMLRCHPVDANKAALAALLNLAVKDETNKINIIEAGALKPIIAFLQSKNPSLQEHAVAALITLSASSVNKPIISMSGAIPLLVEILVHGSSQAKFDAVMALYNLSTHPDSLTHILRAGPIPPLVNLLKSCKKSSRITEKSTALIESLVVFEEGRIALTSDEGGILAVVEVLEGGSRQSREYAVGALLTMCQSDRAKYRELTLREGVIPGLLELTVQGTPKSQSKAQMLLRLLRDNPYPRSELRPDTLKNIVCNIISQIEGEEQLGKAKQMLAEMVQVSMEQSLRHLQKRALVCTQADVPVNSHVSEVSSKCL